MKKQSYICLLAATALSMASCSIENDSVFSESAAQRLNNTEVKYSNLLTSAPYGWAFEYYPTNSTDDGAVLYAVNFKKDGTVIVAGDPSTNHAIQSETSLWDILTDQGPVLSFSTYNQLIHMWSDPNTDGTGYGGDYEFCFVSDPDEDASKVVMLRGKKRGLKSRLKMIEENMTPAEYLLLCDSMQIAQFPAGQRNYSVLHLGDMEYRLDGMKTQVVDYYPMGTDPTFTAHTNSYLLAKYDGKFEMRFNSNFYNSDSTLSERVFIYDPATFTFRGVNGAGEITAPDLAKLVSRDLVNGDLKDLKLIKSYAMGDATKALWDEAEAALKKKNNTLQESVLSTTQAGDEANCTISLKYKPKTGAAATMNYRFNIEQQGETVVLTYVGPASTGAQNVLTSFPACADYIMAFAGTYKVSNPNPDAKFTVGSVCFTSVDDPAKMFTMLASFPAEAKAE